MLATGAPSLGCRTVWPRAADALRASLGPSRGNQRASRELRAALCLAPRSPVVAPLGGQSHARYQSASKQD
eukprot:2733623-Pyramimonas_sp.AAC.1